MQILDKKNQKQNAIGSLRVGYSEIITMLELSQNVNRLN